jgi:hypothetical protein
MFHLQQQKDRPCSEQLQDLRDIPPVAMNNATVNTYTHSDILNIQ